MLTSGTGLLVYARLLGQGIVVTLELGVLAIVFGTLLGAALGTLRVSPLTWLYRAIDTYVQVVRSIPALVFLFVVYYGLPIVLGLGSLSPLTSAALAMSLHNAAYVCQIVRGGLEAVPRGQWEASRALAFSYRSAMRKVILPQALRVILPPFTLQCMGTFKDTSVASVIGLVDVTNTALVIRGNTGSDWDVLGVLALIYFVICASVSAIGRAVERRLDRGYQVLDPAHDAARPAPPRLPELGEVAI
jgi:His/Glu/Gln/Arg/opine family amino acid ABC transporter permease subunit